MKPYAEYKPTGLKWLPEVPAHWEVGKLRHMLKPFSEKGHPESQLLSVVREKGVIVRDKDNDEENHNFIPDDLSGYKYVKPGQFAMNKMKAWQGSYGVSEYEGIVSPAYYVFDLTSDILPRFFHIALRSKFYVPYFGRASDGIRVGQWDLSLQRMKEIPFVVPPPEEQAKIVSYLDAKTAKIDKLIKLKEREIELLQEKKQTVISHVVTRGLNPNVELVDSGVDWIGKIPKGWSVASFKSLFGFKKGLNITKDDLVESGCAVISYGQIHSKLNDGLRLNASLIRFVPETLADEKARLSVGDIVFADTSEDIQGSGNAILIDAKDRIYGGYHTLIAKAKKPKLSLYLSALFRSNIWREQVWRKVNGVKVYSVTQKIFSGITVLIPSDTELAALNEQIIKVVDDTNFGLSLIQKQIALLKEYRTRLISDAVTGKIDLREVAG